MADEARRADRERERAVDDPVTSSALPASIPCPFCDSNDSTPFATFGGQASTAQYYCNDCRTVFEALRWR